MSGIALHNRQEWSEQANLIIKQISSNNLVMSELFPNKEHLMLTSEVSAEFKDNFQKLFSIPMAS